MELHDRYHLENISRNFLQASTVLSPLKDPSHCTGTSLYQSLGCSRIPSVTMATKDTVTSSEQDDSPSPPSSTIKGSLTLSPEQQVRRMSLLHNRKTSHEEDQSTINNYYNWCKSNNSISTSFQSPNQLSRSPRVVSSSQHQCNRKCNVRRRCNSSTYLTNSNSANNNPRTINTVCWPAHPVSCESTSSSSSLSQQASPQQPTTTRRWSITNLYPRSRSTSPSDSQALAPSNVEHCNDTSLASSSPALCSSSKLFTQKNGSRRRRPLSHLSRLGGRSSDHSTADTKSQRSWSSHELSLRGDGNLLLGLENHHRHDSAADVDVATACATSLLLLPAPYTGCNSSSTEGSSRVPMDLGDTENSSSSKAQFAGSRQVSSQHSSEIPQTCSTSSSPSPVPALAMSSVDSNIPPLRPRENLVPSAEDRNVESQLPTGEQQHERVTQISPKRRRIISKRGQTVHPLLSLLWNLITWFTSSSSSSSSNRAGASTPFNMSQVWTFLLSVMLVVTVLPNVAECCSSRSTPRPRPSSPTLRPNITFQTYACPPAYAAWYCLNGATCFTVKIGESILYNCECADGYMGQRCEFKDLDGSYLPTREKVLLETASIAGGATVVIVLVFFVIFSVFLVKNKDKENRDLEGLSRINININSGAASSWPANSDGPHQPPSFSQRTSHTFVTSTTGASSPHTTTISSPPHHMQPGYNHHNQAPAAAAESVVDGKRFVPEQLGGGGGTTMMVDGGHKGRGGGTNTAGEAFYGVPARVVRTVTTITDLASIYTHPRQEVHQVEVLQQVNVLKVDQSKACYNATFVRPSSNASTTALYRGAMWQEAPSNNSPGGKDSPLSWQQFKAMSGLSSPASQTPQNQLSVMPHTPSASSDMDPEVSHVVVPVSEQLTRVAHSGVTLAMASHAVDLNNPEQYQPSSTTLMLANSKMPFQPRLSGDENDSSTTVYISSDETRVKDQSMDESSEDHTTNCFVDHNDDKGSRGIGAVNEAFDSEEENIMNQGCGDGPQRLPFSATNTDRY